MHRVKKKNDLNYDKWIGVGGKFEEKESPEECAKREILEETGLTVDSLKFRGIVTFVSDEYDTEYMHLFTSDRFHGKLIQCDEGILEWIPKSDISKLNLWEGDAIFLNLLSADVSFFSLKLEYAGDNLSGAWLDGDRIR